MKRLSLLTALLALAIAPAAARSDSGWPGWMTVYVGGLPSHDTVRIQVQYETSTGEIKFAHQIAKSGSDTKFPLGTKARNLVIIASTDEGHKAETLRFATVPSSVHINFHH